MRMLTEKLTEELMEKQLVARWLTPSRWKDLEALFGERGACGGCWCMTWRLPRAEWEAKKGEGNRRAFAALVAKGGKPGLLAYAGKEPIAWCAVAPRAQYSGLARARSLKPIDDRPVWSISCFFVRRDWRRRGVTIWLLHQVAEHVARAGGKMLEGYPSTPKKDGLPDAFAWTGLVDAFEQAGFEVVARPSASRAIVRRELTSAKAAR